MGFSFCYLYVDIDIVIDIDLVWNFVLVVCFILIFGFYICEKVLVFLYGFVRGCWEKFRFLGI